MTTLAQATELTSMQKQTYSCCLTVLNANLPFVCNVDLVNDDANEDFLVNA